MHLADDGQAAYTGTMLGHNGQTMANIATWDRDTKFSSGPGIQIIWVLISLIMSKQALL